MVKIMDSHLTMKNVSKQHCLDSCNCDTAYTLGLEKFIPSQFGQTSFIVLVVVVCTLLVVVILGTMHASGLDWTICRISIGIRSDHFEFIGFSAFIFQIWDFFSDLLLCLDIFDHYNQASANNPRKEDYFGYLVLCFIFIFLPWIVNLMFLIKTKRQWAKERVDYSSKQIGGIGPQKVDALAKSSISTTKWLNKYSSILVILCMISGGTTASLKVVNSNLFGLKQFDMGLPKYKQDQTSRHKLWLTIVLENLPQIIISTLYATNLAEFDTTVFVALISSVASVVLALFRIFRISKKVLYLPNGYPIEIITKYTIDKTSKTETYVIKCHL